MTPEPPRRLFALGRWLLERRLPPPLADEADGDLRELWARRANAGMVARSCAFLSDLAGLLAHDRPGVGPSSRPPVHRFRSAFDMQHDIRFAFRLMRRQPLAAALTIATLALGIAASTGIFTAVDRLLLQPLPYPEPDRLVAVANAPFSFGSRGMDVAAGVRRLDEFSGIGVYAEGGLNLDIDGGSIRVPATVASPGFFDAMAVLPAMGRPYQHDDPAGPLVAVISDGLWRRHFGADQQILDRAVSVNDQAFHITGVMPPGFTFPGVTDVWIPVFSDRQATGPTFSPKVVGRLAAGVSPAAAVAALERFNADRGAPTSTDPSQRPGVTTLQDDLTAGARPTLLLLAASVALVLMVSTSNVAGLLLARVTRRQPEFVLRRALGGSRWRLVRLLTIEALVLSLSAGLVGAWLGSMAIGLVASLATSHLPPVDFGMDGRMFAIAMSVAVFTGLLFGLGPGLAASAQPPADALRSASTATSGPGWRRFRSGLVVVQVGAALVLLGVTAMALHTLVRLSRVDLGFSGDSVLGLTVTLPMATYDTTAKAADYVDRARERLAAVPGVITVGATGRLPGDRTVGMGLRTYLPGERARGEAGRPLSMHMVTPGYFETLRIPVRVGRAFADQDSRDAAQVAVLSESAARTLWPDGRNPIGQELEVGVPPTPVTVTIVGVVPDVLTRGPLVDENRTQLYRPIAQHMPFGALSFAVRTAGDPTRSAAALRAALAEVDATLPAYDVLSLDDVTARFLSSHRLAMALLATFAALTLALAAVGLYGVLAQVVAQETRELGIRMALGADGARLQRRVVWSGLRLAGTGTAAGLVATGLAARAIGAWVPALDPMPWAAVAFNASLMLAVAFLACWVPARRAATVDVVQTLRG